MRAGQGRSSGRLGSGRTLRYLPGLLLGFVVGCAPQRPYLDQALLAGRSTPAQQQSIVGDYVLGCPDVLEVVVENRHDLSGRVTIGADGCIELGTLGKLRVE